MRVYIIPLLLLSLTYCQEPSVTRQVKVSFKSDGEIVADSIIGTRDLAHYEQGGHLNCGILNVPIQNSSTRATKTLLNARRFIWDHWHQKKFGYIRITQSSVDATSTAHVFIEQSLSGDWQISWIWARDRNAITRLPVITKVLWPTNANATDESGRVQLVFFDKFGAKICKL